MAPTVRNTKSMASSSPFSQFNGLIGWFITIILVGMVVCMMVSKGDNGKSDKGKQSAVDKGKGKSADKWSKVQGKIIDKGKRKVIEQREGRKKKSTLHDVAMDSDADYDPNQNREEIQEEERSVARVRRPRGPSSGLFGSKPPLKPRRINISGGQ